MMQRLRVEASVFSLIPLCNLLVFSSGSQKIENRHDGLHENSSGLGTGVYDHDLSGNPGKCAGYV